MSSTYLLFADYFHLNLRLDESRGEHNQCNLPKKVEILPQNFRNINTQMKCQSVAEISWKGSRWRKALQPDSLVVNPFISVHFIEGKERSFS